MYFVLNFPINLTVYGVHIYYYSRINFGIVWSLFYAEFWVCEVWILELQSYIVLKLKLKLMSSNYICKLIRQVFDELSKTNDFVILNILNLIGYD